MRLRVSPLRDDDALALFRERARAVRPDGRHTSITNGAKAGLNPAALQARAGHASFSTTQRYISLAGETFRAEAEQLERRLWGERTGIQGLN